MNNSINNERSFTNFLFHNRNNRIIICTALVAMVIQFVIFKYIYPFVNFLDEYSFRYLEEAAATTSNSIHPIGYSRFLRLMSIFTYSDTLLAAVQYLFIQASGLFFIFTLFYFYKPGKLIQYLLLAFMVINPLFLHLANLITRDSLFASLSMLWFALMVWIIHQPSNKIIIWHAIVVFIAFTVRFQAIIFPFIALLAFWIGSIPIRQKLIGATAGLLLCGLYISYQGFQFKKLTGHWQPVPAFGWHLSNNAIFMYKHFRPTDRKPIVQKFKDLDKTIRRYLNKTTNMMLLPVEVNEAGNYYLWQSGSPLLSYAGNKFKQSNDTLASLEKKWAIMAPQYAAYGSYMIGKFPLKYLRYYAGYGAKKYFMPPIEYLDIYNGGKKVVAGIAKNWFRYKNTRITIRTSQREISILNFYPYLNGIMTAILILGLLYYWLLKGWQYGNSFNKTIILGAGVWFINALFTILLTASALRLQTFPIILTTTLALLLVDWMVQLLRIMKLHSENKNSEVSSVLTTELAIKQHKFLEEKESIEHSTHKL